LVKQLYAGYLTGAWACQPGAAVAGIWRRWLLSGALGRVGVEIGAGKGVWMGIRLGVGVWRP
jgi:hypothetical protein